MDFDESTKEILASEDIIQNVINPTAPIDIESDEDVDETNKIIRIKHLML